MLILAEFDWTVFGELAAVVAVVWLFLNHQKQHAEKQKEIIQIVRDGHDKDVESLTRGLTRVEQAIKDGK